MDIHMIVCFLIKPLVVAIISFGVTFGMLPDNMSLAAKLFICILIILTTSLIMYLFPPMGMAFCEYCLMLP